MALADRVVLMNAGRIVEVGNPHDLYRAPRRRFTAEFLGHTNILKGTATGGRVSLPWGEVVGTNGSRPAGRRRGPLGAAGGYRHRRGRRDGPGSSAST